MDLEWRFYPLILFSGFFAGFINMYAGNGSLISLPAMILAGIPANIANASNRVAVFLQNAIGACGYHQKNLLNFNHSCKTALPVMIGSSIGASISVLLNEEFLKKAIGVTMLSYTLIRRRYFISFHHLQKQLRYSRMPG